MNAQPLLFLGEQRRRARWRAWPTARDDGGTVGQRRERNLRSALRPPSAASCSVRWQPSPPAAGAWKCPANGSRCCCCRTRLFSGAGRSPARSPRTVPAAAGRTRWSKTRTRGRRFVVHGDMCGRAPRTAVGRGLAVSALETWSLGSRLDVRLRARTRPRIYFVSRRAALEALAPAQCWQRAILNRGAKPLVTTRWRCARSRVTRRCRSPSLPGSPLMMCWCSISICRSP